MNILFSPSLNKYVFADYGVSHFVKEVPSEKTATYYGGTETYMSEELLQIKGKGVGKVDLYQNDLHALKVTLKQSKCLVSMLEAKK